MQPENNKSEETVHLNSEFEIEEIKNKKNEETVHLNSQSFSNYGNNDVLIKEAEQKTPISKGGCCGCITHLYRKDGYCGCIPPLYPKEEEEDEISVNPQDLTEEFTHGFSRREYKSDFSCRASHAIEIKARSVKILKEYLCYSEKYIFGMHDLVMFDVGRGSLLLFVIGGFFLILATSPFWISSTVPFDSYEAFVVRGFAFTFLTIAIPILVYAIWDLRKYRVITIIIRDAGENFCSSNRGIKITLESRKALELVAYLTAHINILSIVATHGIQGPTQDVEASDTTNHDKMELLPLDQ